jgi:hypothetical protein
VLLYKIKEIILKFRPDMNELKLQTPVHAGKSMLGLSPAEGCVLLGSCFADNIGKRMQELGFNVCVNPFGTLFNPVSVCNSAARLESGVLFTEKECIPMGAGAGLICSFSHHTSFARPTAEAFLANANQSLSAASKAWKEASKVMITLGTAWCFEHVETGGIVSNCLKRDGKEFVRKCLSVQDVSLLLKNMLTRFPGKGFMFTVSPIRHLADGAHGNQLSKSTLLLAVEEACKAFPDRAEYFPAYEIVMDELRDYRFYAPDMVHPSEQAIDYLWGRFAEWAIPEASLQDLENRRRTFLRLKHIPKIH